MEESEKTYWMKILKRVLLGLLAVVAVLMLGFVIWASAAAKPTDAALRALESDKRVSVVRAGWLHHLFAHGRLADNRLHLLPRRARGLSRLCPCVADDRRSRDTFVALVEVSLNLAFFEINAADDVISAHPEVARWVVGGHSLGGVAASSYASGRPEVVSGVVFWASYPADDSLRSFGVPVLSVYGSNDGLTSGDNIEGSRALLPAETTYVLIEGGNHAQFGSYGGQSGDNPASIPAEEQWAQVAGATAKFFGDFEGKMKPILMTPVNPPGL
ncbi:MAG: alpha/beta hydrolase [Desulfobacterales bacterium]|nr:alpha/beta hydrolase [Desulfobacterales bacterium]